MNKVIKLSLLLSLLLLVADADAGKITCPPASLVKAVTFTSVIVYDKQNRIWELLSAPFVHDGVTWNVAYGFEMPGVQTVSEAISRGQASYQSAALIIQSPEPEPIPGYLFCDYTVNGMAYWIQALSPPGQ